MNKKIEYLVDCTDDSEFKTPHLEEARTYFLNKQTNYKARLWKIEDGKKTIIEGYHETEKDKKEREVSEAINNLKDDTKRCFMKAVEKQKWPRIGTYITLCGGQFHLRTEIKVVEEISEERARFLLADGYLDSSTD